MQRGVRHDSDDEAQPLFSRNPISGDTDKALASVD